MLRQDGVSTMLLAHGEKRETAVIPVNITI